MRPYVLLLVAALVLQTVTASYEVRLYWAVVCEDCVACWCWAGLGLTVQSVSMFKACAARARPRGIAVATLLNSCRAKSMN
jgi:hypothetical protein